MSRLSLNRSITYGVLGVVLLHGAISLGVVFVVVDLLAGTVLLMVDLSAFLRCESAAVGCAIVAHFVIDSGFAIFQVTAFARSQLAGLRAVRDACLLVAFTGVGAAHRRRRRPAVIFGSEIAAIRTSQMLVRSLHAGGLNVRFVAG